MFASMCLLLEAKETLIAQAVSGYLRSVEFGKGSGCFYNVAAARIVHRTLHKRPHGHLKGRYAKGRPAACRQHSRCLAAHGTRAVIASGSLLKGHVTSEFGMFDSSRSQKAIGGYHQT